MAKDIIEKTKAHIKKTLYVQVLVVVFAFALMDILSYYFLGEIVRTQLKANAMTMLDSLATSLKADLKEPRTVLGNQAESVQNIIIQSRSKEEVRAYMEEITKYILDEKSNLVGFSGLFGYFDVFGGAMIDGQKRTMPENYMPTERPWYKEAVEANGEIVFIQPHVGLFSPEIVITYARALFDNNEKLLGVIALEMNLDRIREYIVNANLGKLGFGLLLNDKYEIISHKEHSLQGTNFADVNSSTATLVEHLKMGQTVCEYEMRDYKNVLSITCFKKLDNGWYLAIVTPEDEYYSEIRRIRVILLSLAVVLALVVSGILVRLLLEKQKSEAKLREAEELEKNVDILQRVLNSLDAMIYVVVPHTGEILFVNDYMKNHFNIKDDCIGKLCYTVFFTDEKEICEFCPCYELDKNPLSTYVWEKVNPITKRMYRNTDRYIEWHDGRIVLIQHSVDINELYVAREQAITANRVKSDFLARMSHEIRSPMNVILGITEIQLEKRGLPQDTEDALDKVHSSGYMLLNIINDILDLSKIESGKMELTPINYDVASMINDTVQLNIMRFESKPILFHLKVDEYVPATLFGDDLRIKQILNNLISNAFKYTEMGEIMLDISAEVYGEGNPVMLSFRISDTGCGMTQEQIGKLFDDYSRFNTIANYGIEGTGLGMSITKNLVNMMKGFIHVDSEPGKGTTFTLRLPQGYVDSKVLGKEVSDNMQQLYFEKKASAKNTFQIEREYMPYGKILVVDDMEPNLYVARGLLTPYGLSIDTSLNGPDVIEKVKSGVTYDVIFMDHYMPEMDGVQTTKAIRDLGYKNPIIALTANALVGQAEYFLANGFDGFIPKPIDTRLLNAVLNKYIRDVYPAKTVERARKLKEKLDQKNKADLPDFSHLRALVVDDFLPNLNVASGILRKFKMTVDCVLSGQDAVDRMEKGEPKYDIIFMDHLMPDMDGIQTTKLIRSLATEYAVKIPIVALTAVVNNEAGSEQMFLDNGFIGVLSKPLSVAKADAFIKGWINGTIKHDTNAVGTNVNKDEVKKEKKMVVEIPGVDSDKVMELYAGDMEIYLPVLRSYLSVIPDALDKMSKVTAETLPDYVVKVHGVKGTSESIGAEEARKMAYDLEMLAKAGDFSGVMAKNGQLIQYVRTLLTNIEKWLAKL